MSALTASEGHQENDDGSLDTRPYLCIPYWENPRFPGDRVDTGELRGLPGDVVSWDCHAIHVGPYVPGKRLDVTVDIRNSGHGSTSVLATVLVYWADPSVGFVKPTFFGVATVVAPPIRDPLQPGFETTATISATIPAGAADHICLLVAVTHSLDQAATVSDPINDRHWAQRNLIAVAASSTMVKLIPFVVGNPFSTEELFELRVQALERRALETMAGRMRAEPSEQPPRVRLLDERGCAVTDNASHGVTRIALGSRKRRRFGMAIEVGRLGGHEFTAVQAVLARREKPVGSLGIVIRGDEDAGDE